MLKYIKNKKGSITSNGILLLGIATIISIMAAFAVGIKTSTARSITSEVHDALVRCSERIIVDNANESYQGKRETYSGAYNSNTYVDIMNVTQEENVKNQLSNILKLNTPAGKKLGKYERLDNGKYKCIYYIDSIKMKIKNPSLLDNDETITTQLEAKICIPLQFNGYISKTNIITLTVTSDSIEHTKL